MFVNKSLEEISKVFNEDLKEFDNKFVVPVGEISDRIGLKIEFCELENEQSGKLENNIIYVNDLYSGSRNLFTIAHEIGHFVINKGTNITRNRFDCKDSYVADEVKEEIQANNFAADLLMPSEVFKDKFIDFDKNLTKLSKFFGTSRTACEYRAINLGLLNVI